MSKKQSAEYKCDKCQATFKDADALFKHQRVHEGNREDQDLGQGIEQPMEAPTLPPHVTPPGIN